MFTGIIQHVGRLAASRPEGAGRRLRIDLGPLADDLRVGDSVAVHGVCLTACRIERPQAEFDVVEESLSRSTLGTLRAGDRVNLERALSASGRFDGHIVQGHVDGVAKVVSVQREPAWAVDFSADETLVEQMAPKGSVAIDGVSLTLADTEDDRFRVALIPTTLAQTTLADLAVGNRVNVEIDILGKYVRRFVRQIFDGSNSPASEGLTLEKLKEAGFL